MVCGIIIVCLVEEAPGALEVSGLGAVGELSWSSLSSPYPSAVPDHHLSYPALQGAGELVQGRCSN